MSTEQISLLISELIYQKKVSSQADFGRKLGYKGRSYVSDMVNGKKPANIDNEVLKAFTEVNPEWLKTGEGKILMGISAQKRTGSASQLENEKWKDKYIKSLEKNQAIIEKLADRTMQSHDNVMASLAEMDQGLDEHQTMIEGVIQYVTKKFARLDKTSQKDEVIELHRSAADVAQKMKQSKKAAVSR